VSLGNDACDIGQLLSYALRPKMRPGLEGEYGRLLRRYQDEMGFRDAFNDVLDGMHLRVLHAGDLGLVPGLPATATHIVRMAVPTPHRPGADSLGRPVRGKDQGFDASSRFIPARADGHATDGATMRSAGPATSLTERPAEPAAVGVQPHGLASRCDPDGEPVDAGFADFAPGGDCVFDGVP